MPHRETDFDIKDGHVFPAFAAKRQQPETRGLPGTNLRWIQWIGLFQTCA
jgi:hypothetical protein